MKKIVSIFILTIVLLPTFIFAQCNYNDFTIIYINGILTSEDDARRDLLKLQTKYEDKNKIINIKFLNGYNATHVEGFGDLMKSVKQAYDGGKLDYDLTNILNQVHSELSTRKVLLIGHSQGTFYTNAAYNYLVGDGGVPKESIFVYNTATLADRVAGGGDYLTSSTDKVINEIVRELAEIGDARKPLSANITIELSEEENNNRYGGHSFGNVYLAGAPEKIIGDINKELNNLSVSSDKFAGEGCFTPPKIGLVHKLKGIGFFVVDNTTGAFTLISQKTFGAVQFVSNAIAEGAEKVYKFGESVVNNLGNMLKNPKLLGAALNLEANQSSEASDTGSSDQNSQNKKPEDKFTGTGGPDPSTDIQEQMDDLLEIIDILKRKIADELAKRKNEDVSKLLESQINQVLANYDGGSESSNYPKILISEIKIGGASDEKEEFVELYNPNDENVDLDDWYLQRKTKTGSSYSSYAPNSLFSGKIIRAGGYLLIARQGYFSGIADIFTDNPLTEDNTLVLKNPKGEISDMVGFGEAQDYEGISFLNPPQGKSIGRKRLSLNNTEQDTDNNLLDFEVQNSTPKQRNSSASSPEDVIAPEVAFDLEAMQNNVDFDVKFNITDAGGTLGASGIKSYIFRWKEDSGDWVESAVQDIFGNPVNLSVIRNLTGNDERTHYFQVKAKDVDGNESDWLPVMPAETRISIFKKILINEIQTSGVTAKDEFIELYNPNNVDVALGGFSLKKKTSTGTESNLVSSPAFSGVIEASGFFLIAPQKNSDGTENYTGSATPDLRYSGATFSVANNNTILLYNKDDILLDKVGFGSATDFETAPTVNPDDGKSIGRKRVGLDTDNNSDDFRKSQESTPKGLFPKSFIQDVTDYSNCLNGINQTAYCGLVIRWSSSAGNVEFYQLQYKINDGEWIDWVSNTSDTEKKYQAPLTMLKDKTYSFRVRAQDTDGNLGSWAEVSTDMSHPVVINEFAILGTNAGRDDRWLELYNRSDKPIDLSGWKIVSGSFGAISLNQTLEGTIPAKGYFVLESQDDNTISDVSADQFLDGYISGYIYLYDSKGRQVDQIYVPSHQGCYCWFESDFKKEDGNYYSFERVSSYSFGINDKNWIINNGITTNGRDRNDNPIYGTPGQQNSNYQLYTILSADFVEDATLPLSLSPYLIPYNQISVHENVELTIESGVVVKFYRGYGYPGIIIDGSLKAIGDSNQPIVFTSFFDDEYGGDMGKNDSQVIPPPGDWLGLRFTKESDGSSQLENVIIRYAGILFALSEGAGIKVDQTTVSIKNSTIENTLYNGIWLVNSSSVIDNVSVLKTESVQNYDVFFGGKGILVEGGSPQITNSYFRENRYGIYANQWADEENNIYPSYPTIQANNFERNENIIFLGDNVFPSFGKNQAEGNDFNAIIVGGNIFGNVTWQKGLIYLVKNNLIVHEGATLTIGEGVVVKFHNHFSGLDVKGVLNLLGTAESPVIFTSFKDDIAGDTNKDEATTEPAAGDWLGIKISGSAELDNINLRYGGRDTGSSLGAGIKVDKSSISLKNSVIENNLNNGIWLVNPSSAVIDNTTIKKQDRENERGIYMEGGNLELSNSFIQNNHYGLYITNWSNEGNIIPPNVLLSNNTFAENVTEILDTTGSVNPNNSTDINETINPVELSEVEKPEEPEESGEIEESKGSEEPEELEEPEKSEELSEEPEELNESEKPNEYNESNENNELSEPSEPDNFTP